MKRVFFSFFLFMVLFLVGWELSRPLIVDKPLQKLYNQLVNPYWRELTRGTYHILMESLTALPPEAWQNHFQHLQPEFGYPISLNDISKLSLSQTELNQLMSGKIVVKGDADFFYQRVPGSEKAITMGPFPELNAPLWINTIVWAILIFCVGLMATIWALPFWLPFSVK